MTYDADCPVCGRERKVPWTLTGDRHEIIGKCQKCGASMPEIEEAAGLVPIRTMPDGACEANNGRGVGVMLRSGGEFVWRIVGCKVCSSCRAFTHRRKVAHTVEQFRWGGWLMKIPDTENDRRSLVRKLGRRGASGWMSFTLPGGERAYLSDEAVTGALWVPPAAVEDKVTALYALNPGDGRRDRAGGRFTIWKPEAGSSVRVGFFDPKVQRQPVTTNRKGHDELKRITPHCEWLGALRKVPEDEATRYPIWWMEILALVGPKVDLAEFTGEAQSAPRRFPVSVEREPVYVDLGASQRLWRASEELALRVDDLSGHSGGG